MQSHPKMAMTMLLLAAPLLLLLHGNLAPLPAAAQAPPVAIVRMSDAPSFEPAEIRIRSGQTVTWENVSSYIHTVTDDPSLAENPANSELPEGAAPWDSGEIRPGQSFSKSFGVPGTYRYFCKPHESAGMVGVIVVE